MLDVEVHLAKRMSFILEAVSQIAILGPSRWKRAYRSKLLFFFLILQTLYRTFRKDRLVGMVIGSVLISKQSLNAILWKMATFKLLALLEEMNLVVVLGSGAMRIR